MVWFNRYEYEKDKELYISKICQKIPSNIIIFILIFVYYVRKTSGHIEWQVFKSFAFFEYLLNCLIYLTVGPIIVIKWGFDFICWLIDNKKKAKNYLLWIIISIIALIICHILIYCPLARLAKEMGFIF